MTHIRVTAETRDALREIRDGRTYSETVAYLCGEWTRVNGQAAANRGAKAFTSDGCAVTTTVRVSDDCHAVLQAIRSEMAASSLSEAIGILILNHRMN